MNGVDAVVIATGNDWRAVEAGAHAYAARSGSYTSLSTWNKDADGNLAGTLEMPMAVGIVGGATRVHPTAKAALKLMGVQTASQLAEIIVSVGLAQNLAALRALATEGIQRGHMGLHARQVAIAAGAAGEQIDRLADQMVAERNVRIDRAEEILREWSQVYKWKICRHLSSRLLKTSRPVGLIGYGAYVPRYRLPAVEVARVWAGGKTGGLPIKEKAVAGMDEDVITMSIEAARNALARAKVSPEDAARGLGWFRIASLRGKTQLDHCG